MNNPDEFLAWVVKSKLGLDSSVGVRFSTSELELFKKVFVLNLSKLTTFISIKVDVVNKERSITKNWDTRGWDTIGAGDVAFRSLSE